jgi:hypothetical protein
MKGFIKQLLKEGLIKENNSIGIVEFLKDKDFKSPSSKTFLYHGTNMNPNEFTLRDDYEWEDSNGWSGDLPYDHLFLTTDIKEAMAYGRYIIPCELKDYKCLNFKVNDSAPSRVFDKDYGIDLFGLDEPFNFWDKYEDSGKSCLAIKGIGKTTIISHINNIIPRTDLAIEYYNDTLPSDK